MGNNMDVEDPWAPWEHDASQDPLTLNTKSERIFAEDQEKERLGQLSRSLYEKYGTNEPYIEPEDVGSSYHRDSDDFFKLMTGPSTNLYVGLEARHFPVPKLLLYHFSAYAKVCLEGNFLEADENAIWLPDVDPDEFQWLCQWLYTGKLKVYRYYRDKRELRDDERFQTACRLLCRLHVLGERLLFDERFLQVTVQRELSQLVEEAATPWGVGVPLMPLMPDVVGDVLMHSAPVEYGLADWCSLSLRPFVLGQLRSFDFCTVTDFTMYAECFELDGAFAAEIMVFITEQVEWAVERWRGQVDSPVDIIDVKRELAEDQGLSESAETVQMERQGFWLALRIMCTFAGCTTTDLRAYSQCFELDGTFAAEILNHKAKELLWVIERWGEERGSKVDFLAEKEEEERVAQEESDLQRFVDKIMRRDGWS